MILILINQFIVRLRVSRSQGIWAGTGDTISLSMTFKSTAHTAIAVCSNSHVKPQ
jgi:hypothetical protein